MRYRAWCDRVRAIAGVLPPEETVSSLNWSAFFLPPKSWSKRKQLAAIGTLHRQKPDRDNVDKAVLDCLYPGGDSAIARGSIGKYWGTEPRIVIVIELNRSNDDGA
jgi:Holliday junction resolvase RusA-like endonuclease